MTRLKSEQIKIIPETLDSYERELKFRIGVGLIGAAEHAANTKIKRNFKVAVVPCTVGLGVIEGFSKAVSAILKHIGLDSFVTANTDVAGFFEAVRRGAGAIYSADENVFAAFNLHTGKASENSEATGKAYAAALDLACGGVNGRLVSVIGLGPVGSSAIKWLISKRARVYAYDLASEKMESLKRTYPDSMITCHSLKECVQTVELIVLATPVANVITEDLIRKDIIISAPGVPLGLSDKARLKLPKKNLIHDPLHLGVATMAVEVLS